MKLLLKLINWIKTRKEKEFFLIDYKGKFTVISDTFDDEWEIKVGTITKKEAIEQAEWRKESARYYGIRAYIGDDKDLLKIYK